MACSTLCTFVDFIGVLLILKTDSYGGSGVETKGFGMGDNTTILIEESNVPDTQQFRSTSAGDVRVFATAAGEEKTGCEELGLCDHEFVVCVVGVFVDEKKVSWG